MIISDNEEDIYYIETNALPVLAESSFMASQLEACEYSFREFIYD